MTLKHTTCPRCGLSGIVRTRLLHHQARSVCKVRAFRKEMEALDYAPIVTADAEKLADVVDKDLAWANQPLRRGPVAVCDEDPTQVVLGFWWPSWCDYLCRATPLVLGRDVLKVQTERVRTLLLDASALRAYKARVRVWRAQGVDPEERFHIWRDLATLHN